MTKRGKGKPAGRHAGRAPEKHSGVELVERGNGSRWLLKDAKARLSEVVQRSAHQPQTLTVHGKPKAVVISTEEYARLKGERTGKSLIALFEGSSLQGVEIERPGVHTPVRAIEL